MGIRDFKPSIPLITEDDLIEKYKKYGPSIYNPKRLYTLLTDKQYLVRLPYLAIYTPEREKYYGKPTIIKEDGTIDVVTPVKELTTTYIKLLGILKYYSEGYPVIILYINDLVEIRNKLFEFLYFNEMNPNNFFREELIEIVREFLDLVDSKGEYKFFRRRTPSKYEIFTMYEDLLNEIVVNNNETQEGNKNQDKSMGITEDIFDDEDLVLPNIERPRK